MENNEKIKKLINNANSIYNLFNILIPKWQKDKATFDKVGWGFNEDDRFNACKSVSIGFSSHAGVYGNSSCYTQVHLDDDVFKKHLVLYLNNNKETIMLAIAEQIKKEAATLKQKAEKELTDAIEKLQKLEE